MRYVIIRDDDTNALTPVECLEQLYRPFLDRGFPVNLATIPNVRTDTKIPSGELEGFLSVICLPATPEVTRGPTTSNSVTPDVRRGPFAPIASNPFLIDYLKSNPEFRIVQHGWQHDYFEFDRPDAPEIARRLDDGRRFLEEAGLGAPRAFVAPYDKLSRPALREVAKRFRVLSTGWFELRRLPPAWWPRYAIKRTSGHPHWRIDGTTLLTHPGCLLSCHRDCGQMLDNIKTVIANQRLTVLVTHWWEYFRNGQPNQQFIDTLHATAELLGSDPNLRVISFDDLVDSSLPLN